MNFDKDETIPFMVRETDARVRVRVGWRRARKRKTNKRTLSAQ